MSKRNHVWMNDNNGNFLISYNTLFHITGIGIIIVECHRLNKKLQKIVIWKKVDKH